MSFSHYGITENVLDCPS